MRQELVGYVLGALDDGDHQRVEGKISGDTQLQHELQLLRSGITPLEEDQGMLDPPPGLARRTCAYVEQHLTSTVARPSRHGQSAATADQLSVPVRRWSMIDLAAAAGILVALGMLIVPAINHSRFSAQVAACQNKLQQIGFALHDYSKHNDGLLPEIPQSGPLSVAGVYAPKLLEAGVVSDPGVFVCGGCDASQAQQAKSIPTWGRLVQLQNDPNDELAEVIPTLGGSYGYNLGYMEDGLYHTASLGRSSRPTYALMADAPCPRRGFSQSSNHAGNGQNVLFEDLHVDYLSNGRIPGGSDELFRNDAGMIGAGTHANDSVVGACTSSPHSGK